MKNYFIAALLCLSLSANAQFVADFEIGNLNEWQQSPDETWSATTASGRISENFSLRHIGSSSAATDYISAPIQHFDVSAGITTWQFRMKYNYNPTNTNKWAIILMADTSATEWNNSGNFNGYAIGVNQVTADKRLCLYAINNGVYSELLKTVINWNDSIGTASTTIVAIEIIRDAIGEWDLRLAKSTSFDDVKSYGTIIDAQHLSANYFGAISIYSSASAGAQRLWLDDISISSTVFPSKILNVAQQNPKTLVVNFTKPLLANGLTNNGNYKLKKESIIISPNVVERISETQVQLSFTDLLPRGNVSLSVENLTDENNNLVADSKELVINYNLYGDLVINEIMASPAPSVELPEVAYIELYNRRDEDVTIIGWKMEYITTSSGNVTSGNIGNTVIPANGYLILCTSSTLDVMRDYGAATSLSNISNLTKSGKTLVLKDAAEQTIALVTYSDQWFADETKQAGGWSLEKIDVNNFSESATNWAASTNEKGGTPGQANSVQTNNPDTEAPFITNFSYIDDNTLRLTFNELFDTTNAKNILCYTLNNGIGQANQVILNNANPLQVEIRFASSLVKGILYTLTVSAPFCDLAGNVPVNLHHTFGNLFSPQQEEIVINEVLFNPYPNGVDFVEIYNRSNKIFDLRQVKIANRDSNNDVASIRSITEQYFLQPNEYAVFTTNLEAIQQFYTVLSPEKVIVLNGFPSYPDNAGCVVLLSDNDIIVDEFLYSAKMHNGFIANPEGISLERVNPDRKTNESANWQSAAQDAGFATPTYRNSQLNIHEEISDNEFSLPYEVFSPDGDGYNDVLFIDYNLSTSGYVATITIYDAQGRLVREVEGKILLGLSGRLSWDGTRYDNRKAAPGVYVVFIELYDLNGNIKRIKKSCAVALRK